MKTNDRAVALSLVLMVFVKVVPAYTVFFEQQVVFTLALAASRRRWLLSAYSHLCLLAASAVLFYVSTWLLHPVYSLVR